MAEFKDIDRGWDAIKRQAGKSASVGVGWSGDAAQQVATHEYGSPAEGIPESGSVGAAFDRSIDQIGNAIGDLAPLVMEGSLTAEQVLTAAGEQLAKDIGGGAKVLP